MKNTDYGISNFRIIIVCIVVLVSFAFLITRLLWIQVWHPEYLIKEGNNRVIRHYTFEPARGIITDRFGKPLAISVPVKTIYADSQLLHQENILQNKEKIEKIANLLNMDKEELIAKIKDPKKRHVKLKQYMPLDKASELEALKIQGILINDNYQRYYPTGNINAHLVGILNSEGNGIYGVEQSFNSYLTAHATRHVAKKDRLGHVIENIQVLEEGRAGGNLRLSVDDRLQAFAYTTLEKVVSDFDAESATCVLMDVKTGEVLVMVNYPSFDPNDRSVFDSKNATNRAVTDTLEPGSTLKPFVSLSALEHNLISWNEVFDTRPFIVNGKTIKDTHYMSTGTLQDIIKYSSNTGMARIALREGPQDIIKTLQRFGFGAATSSGLVGEVSGRLNEHRKFWSEIDKATIGFGYGIAVTALQLTSAYATLANYGQYHPVSILRMYDKSNAIQIANVKEIKRMHDALETVVEAGTGGRATINKYRIAGKTGTAKIASVGGYSNNYISSFAGFAPISNPRFALVAIVKDPKKGSIYGGTVSGPIFREVMTRALQLYNVPPDK